MSVVLLYPLSPLPLMRAQRCEQRFSQSPACREFAYFLTTGIIFSTFALPVVLAHAAVVSCSLNRLHRTIIH
ncbi:unnamed protein product [Toxocara canis]|uniref:G_PROTEIN_RECEP_F1_2 domain-containing protein n=1 Tax=Toxocara canis TaxID=6265 RepID=A0A183U3S0_TOXCA|nr:unnamed protein product [Toxocara canis]